MRYLRIYNSILFGGSYFRFGNNIIYHLYFYLAPTSFRYISVAQYQQMALGVDKIAHVFRF